MKEKAAASQKNMHPPIRLVCGFPERQGQDDDAVKADVKKILSMELKQQLAQK